jgi:hypothetical protein
LHSRFSLKRSAHLFPPDLFAPIRSVTNHFPAPLIPSPNLDIGAFEVLRSRCEDLLPKQVVLLSHEQFADDLIDVTGTSIH